MKRINNLYQKIYDINNLNLADQKASRGKSKQYGVKIHNKNREQNILKLQQMLVSKTYQTSPYVTFKVFEPKERLVYRLPYFPDRIAHHAAMNVLEPIFVSMFTADTYSCIKGKGIHAAANNLRRALYHTASTGYCLKLDIKKFYPSINHQILKDLLARKFKDQDLLRFLGNIIDSAPGIPIGNYLSQYFANFYLSGFDHWVKEDLRVKHYFRYADDIVILGSNKPYLHSTLSKIRQYLASNLALEVKHNYQVFPVRARGIDFLGYVFYHSHTRLRKRIKLSMARAFAKGNNQLSKASYLGWAKHCNSKHLIKKIAT